MVVLNAEETFMSVDSHRVCPWRNAYFFDNTLRRLFQNPEQIVRPYINEGAVSLDLGCGMGFFSIAIAKVAGPRGRVYSCDIQQPMLDVLAKRAARAGVGDRITTALAPSDGPELPIQADFAVASWVIHEVDNLPLFLSRLRACLKPGAGFLIMEPKFHVSLRQFDETIKTIEEAGFKLTDRPKIALSSSAFFMSNG